MLLSQCKDGNNDGPLDLEIVGCDLLTEEVFRIILADKVKRNVGVFIEGANMIGNFGQLREGTRLSLRNFVTSKDYDRMSRYFPTYVPGESVVLHESNCDFYINLSNTETLVEVWYNNRSLKFQMNSDITAIRIGEIYEAKKVCPAQPDRSGGSSKFQTLRQIHDSIKNSIYAWCYAVIVDCCSSYIPKQGDTSDHLVIYKITDNSIFPEVISLNIFHRNPKEIPKIANFGDIIKLNDIQFKEHNGSLTGIIPSNSKSMSFNIFSCIGDNNSPYANYKGQFHMNNDHSSKLEKLSDWVKNTFSYEVPLCIKNSKHLTNLTLTDEADILTRVVAISSLGTQDNDPIVCICSEANEIAQLVVPNERKKLLKFIKPGDIVRVRGVCYEEKVLVLKHYSEILRIPNEFKCLEIIEPSNMEELNKYIGFYSPIAPCKVISTLTSEYMTLPVLGFDKIFKNYSEKHIRIDGFVVKVGMKNREILLTIWDGTKEENVINVYVEEKKFNEFLNGKSWEDIQKNIIGYNLKFQGVIRKDYDVLRLAGTSLI